MNFETDYKNIHFQINLERENVSDLSQLMGDKFNRLPNQTMTEIKNGNLTSYNILIISKQNDEELTHYLPSVILTSKDEELMEEIGHYLDQEGILDDIAKCWNRNAVTPGPVWRIPI